MIKKIVNLVFKSKPNNKQPIKLVFGGGDTPEAGEHIINAELSLFDFGVNGSALIDYGLNDGLIYAADAVLFGDAFKVDALSMISWENPTKLLKDGAASFGQAEKIDNYFLVNWGVVYKFSNDTVNSWRTATIYRAIISNVFWYSTDKEQAAACVDWRQAKAERKSAVVSWGKGGNLDKYGRLSWGMGAAAKLSDSAILWGLSKTLENNTTIVWGNAGMPGGCGPSVRPPFIPPYIPPHDSITIVKNLVFCHKPNNKNPINLIFGRPCDESESNSSIPLKEVYIVKNSIDIFRTKDGRKIKAIAADIGTSRGDWAWSGSLTLPYSELPIIEGRPEIEVNINHLKFIFDIEEISTKKVFNNTVVDISLVSTTKRLAKIPAHELTTDLTAQNIAIAQIKRDDLETGFNLKYTAVDWIIQPGLIKYAGATALDVMTEISTASGETLCSHAHLKELMIKPKYPLADPRLSLPVAKLFSHDLTVNDFDDFNSVIVSGENIGVTANAKKEGTAGEKMAPMFINRLLTEEAVARRAAFNIIHNTNGTKTVINANFPLFKEVPQLYPSDRVEIGTERGEIESININAALENDALTVRVDLEIIKS